MQVPHRSLAFPRQSLSTLLPALAAPAIVLAVTVLVGLFGGDLAGRVPGAGFIWFGALTAVTLSAAVFLVHQVEQLHRAIRDEQELNIHHQRRFARVLESTDSCVTIVDQNGAIAFQNACITGLTGLYPWEVNGQSFSEIFGSENRSRVAGLLASAVMNGRSRSGEIAFTTGPLGRRHVVLTVSNQQDDPDVNGIIVTTHDMSAVVDARNALERASAIDPVTDINNRDQFRALVRERIEHGPARSAYALAVIDLVGFREINVELGSDAANAILRVIGHRLSTATTNDDVVGRIDGDRFGLLISGTDPARWLTAVLGATFDRPVAVGDRDIPVRGQSGYCLVPADLIIGVDRAMANAETALDTARANDSTEPVQFGDARPVSESWVPAHLDVALALERGEFELHYQPIVMLDRCDIVEMEALLRWNHPMHGEINPVRFLPLTETTDLIGPLSWWVIDEACRQGSIWLRDRSNRPLTMSVNISARMFHEPDLIERLSLILCERSFPAQLLRLEIVESVLIDDIPRATGLLNGLKAIGIQLAIDDFGTGFSSLAYLQHFPVDVIKIDRAFVRGMTENLQSAEIVRSIVDLARKLNIETTGEGIETVAQLEQLRELGSIRGQGFLFSRPLPAFELDLALEDEYAAFAA